jgi:hypothetical protein
MVDFGWNWDTLRLVDFLLTFVAFVILVYRGVFKMVFDRQYFYWDRLMNMVWCFVISFSTGQILYDHGNVAGGSRLWVTLCAALFQLYIVTFRWPYTHPGRSDELSGKRESTD